MYTCMHVIASDGNVKQIVSYFYPYPDHQLLCEVLPPIQMQGPIPSPQVVVVCPYYKPLQSLHKALAIYHAGGKREREREEEGERETKRERKRRREGGRERDREEGRRKRESHNYTLSSYFIFPS